nr:fatty acyl-AMP ligase [Leptolyngbyaceae cyanobacterium MO_188.B28]
MQTLNTYLTLIDLLCDRAHEHPGRTAFTFLKDGETVQNSVTYQKLVQRAQAIAAHLSASAAVGDRALLIYPFDRGIEFIEAFLGCLFAGVIPLCSLPPRNRHSITDIVGRLISSDARVILTSKSLQANLQRQLKQSEDCPGLAQIRWIASEEIPTDLTAHWRRPEVNLDTLAFLQYTSGSTGLPKGVMITHRCLLHNQQLLKLAFGHTDALVGMGWLPLFHDMGLIGNVLQVLYMGAFCVLMSPLAFIQKPVRWLQVISRYRVTTSGGPNFAYDLLCRYVKPDQLQQLDLSSWEVAFSGAEPVRAATLDQFAAKFAPCGFRREAFYPCYGMAEATLFITGGQKSAPPHIGYVDKMALEKNQVVWADPAAPLTRSLVGCGHAWLDGQVAIVHPETRHRRPPNQVGEIWVSGAGMGKGYWNEPDKTERTFQGYLSETGEGPFLRTGDLGFLHEGELFITGRRYDVL